MISIVIPLGSGSMHNNAELKFCLASIEKNLSGYDKIYIIGDHPGFEGNFIHVPAKDHGFNFQDNIRRKIEIACQHPGVSQNFFFSNDDHFYVKPFNVNDMPYYYDGDLELAYRRKRKEGWYKIALLETKIALEKRFYATYHFDIHVPIIYNKILFPKAMALYDWRRCRSGYVIKSLYCNTLMIKGEKYNDMKIFFDLQDKGQIDAMIQDRFMFSVDSQGTNEVMIKYLQDLFPEVVLT